MSVIDGYNKESSKYYVLRTSIEDHDEEIHHDYGYISYMSSLHRYLHTIAS